MIRVTTQKDDSLIYKPGQDSPRNSKLTKGFIGIIAAISVIAVASINYSTDSQQSALGFEDKIVTLSRAASQDQSLDTIVNKLLRLDNKDCVQAIYDTFFDPQNLLAGNLWNDAQIRMQKVLQVSPNATQLAQLKKDRTQLGQEMEKYLKSKDVSNLEEAIKVAIGIMSITFHESNHQGYAAHYSQFGTILVVLKRELAYNNDKDRDNLIKDLQSDIETYQENALKLYETLYNETAKRYKLQVDKEVTTKSNLYTFANGNVKSYIGSESEDFITESRANVQYDLLVREANLVIITELDALILPSTKWQFFLNQNYSIPQDPVPLKKAILSYSANFGKGISHEELDPFNDEQLFSYGGDISVIEIRAGSIVNGLQFTYGTVTAQPHGGYGQRLNYINLASGEKIVKVFIRAGDLLDGIGFVTNTGKRYWYGGDGGTYYEAVAPEGGYLAAIRGLQGSASIGQISFVWVTYK
ncbi:UNKNOWN [Stylonychia lemnae]|uniref:Jacalin-type lectin domain-containing protein n=1 Tax=Stylonychia lemnae TaxID=5949 RepID=A0A078B4L7_STYLE|nr:UNKNOWN [Stylonychia lemnae]|eukprot:CDW88448.1 UNKNOWN [Stylonychia lemnae]